MRDDSTADSHWLRSGCTDNLMLITTISRLYSLVGLLHFECDRERNGAPGSVSRLRKRISESSTAQAADRGHDGGLQISFLYRESRNRNGHKTIASVELQLYTLRSKGVLLCAVLAAVGLSSLRSAGARYPLVFWRRCCFSPPAQPIEKKLRS